MTIDKKAAERTVVFLDTETTGLQHNGGDKIVEIGAIEYIDRTPTGRTFHVYLDPQRDVPEEAYEVHNLSRDDLVRLSKGKIFADISEEFIEFIRDAEVIAHNAGFDVNFINAELAQIKLPPIENYGVKVTDSLKVANTKHPGQANNLDALLKRYIGADNFERGFHGALLDASLLARVYLLMTVQQRGLDLESRSVTTGPQLRVERLSIDPTSLPLATLDDGDRQRHENLIKRIAKESGGKTPDFSPF